MDRQRHDTKQRYGVEVNILDIGEDFRQEGTEVNIAFPVPTTVWHASQITYIEGHAL